MNKLIPILICLMILSIIIGIILIANEALGANRPPLINQTPAYSYRPHYNHYRGYLIQPYAGYGGYKYYHPTRKAWTNYQTPNTSWGYKTKQPTQKSLGIPPGHQNTSTNPRSLYYKGTR